MLPSAYTKERHPLDILASTRDVFDGKLSSDLQQSWSKFVNYDITEPEYIDGICITDMEKASKIRSYKKENKVKPRHYTAFKTEQDAKCPFKHEEEEENNMESQENSILLTRNSRKVEGKQQIVEKDVSKEASIYGAGILSTPQTTDEEKETILMRVCLDSGADLSCLPLFLLKQAGISTKNIIPCRKVNISGSTGIKSNAEEGAIILDLFLITPNEKSFVVLRDVYFYVMKDSTALDGIILGMDTLREKKWNLRLEQDQDRAFLEAQTRYDHKATMHEIAVYTKYTFKSYKFLLNETVPTDLNGFSTFQTSQVSVLQEWTKSNCDHHETCDKCEHVVINHSPNKALITSNNFPTLLPFQIKLKDMGRTCFHTTTFDKKSISQILLTSSIVQAVNFDKSFLYKTMNEAPKEQRHRHNNETDTVELDDQQEVSLEVQERLNKLDITPVSGGDSINIDHLDKETKTKVNKILLEFNSIFSTGPSDIGIFSHCQFSLPIKEPTKKIIEKPRLIDRQTQQDIRPIIETLIEANVIEESSGVSNHVVNSLPVQKPPSNVISSKADNFIRRVTTSERVPRTRLCVDSRSLNAR